METLLASPDADALTRRLSDLIAAGRIDAARPMLAALRRLTPPSARLAELAAMLAMREGRLGDARGELDAAISEHPGQAALHRCRAELRHRIGDLPGAALDAADAVVLDPAAPSGKAMLGMLMTELGRPADGCALPARGGRRGPGESRLPPGPGHCARSRRRPGRRRRNARCRHRRGTRFSRASQRRGAARRASTSVRRCARCWPRMRGRDGRGGRLPVRPERARAVQPRPRQRGRAKPMPRR